MSFEPFFNQIELSKVQSRKGDPNNQSLIQELNMLEAATVPYLRATRIQSFIYAEPNPPEQNELKFSEKINLDRQISVVRSFRPQRSKQQSHLYRLEPREYYKLRAQNEGHQIIQHKSIRQQLIEQNKLLQQKLQYNKMHLHPNQAKDRAFQKNPILSKIKNHLQRGLSGLQAPTNLQTQRSNPIEILQQQYNHSSVIKFYNFILKELPCCSRCSNSCDIILPEPQCNRIGCRHCELLKENSKPFIGVLYDIENKARFEDELAAYQASLEAIDLQIDRLKRELYELDSLKEKIITLKHLSRKKYREVNQSKQYFKQYVNNISTSHLQKLAQLIPKEYISQLQLWAEVQRRYKCSWKVIYDHIYRLIPIFLHDHTDSKLLSALHKLLNYQNEQSVKIAVSESIKFPLKQIQRAVLVVDGSYNLPVFENIRHLQLHFQNKKTQRQLDLLFSNFPRAIFSLKLNYDHKIHSHISAQTFPFFKHLAAFLTIKQLDVTIKNVKDFSEVARLYASVSQKIDLRIRVTKHIFCQQQLILPENFFDSLITNLGYDLVRCEIQLPYSIDSPAKINYHKYISNRLCFFKISRSEKSQNSKGHFKLLEEMDEERKVILKKRENIFRKLLSHRLRLVHIIRKNKLSESNTIMLIEEVQSLLWVGTY